MVYIRYDTKTKEKKSKEKGKTYNILYIFTFVGTHTISKYNLVKNRITLT